MMHRYNTFAPGEYYHLLGRGNYKQDIFLDKGDYSRFLFLILHFQLPKPFPQLSRKVHSFVQHRVLDTEGIEDRYVELVNFCLMPNHYHLTAKETADGGISKYMQRVLNSFTKYHNTKYEKRGHLFQGPFKAVHVKTNKQLLYLSCYIHRNPREGTGWRGKEHLYPWSSYQDYIRENRWGQFLKPDIVLEQFETTKEYKSFTETSNAKESERTRGEKIEEEHLF